MKKRHIPAFIILALVFTGALNSYAEGTHTMDIRVMSFNIRNGRANDGEDSWPKRKTLVCDVIREYAPDVLGVQEAFRFQLDVFKEHLTEYGEIGTGRNGGSKGEYAAILYRKDRFSVTDSGTFWLSDTPDTPSTTWGHHYRRVCTWAQLIETSSERPVFVYNTHLDHESQPAREKSVRLIMKHIHARTPKAPFLLMGDFNAGEDNPVTAYLTADKGIKDATPLPLVDSFRVLHPDAKDSGTYSGFDGRTDSAKIDYIFVDPETRTTEATINRTHRDRRYPSDHYPVTATLHFD